MASLSLNDLNAAGRFARLPYTLTDNSGSRTSIPADFLDRREDPNHGERLRLDKLSGTPDVIYASVTGSTKLSLKLVSSVPPSAMLPQVGTDLNLTWVIGSAEVDPQDDNATFGGRPILSLENNRVNLHSFFNGFAALVLRKIDEATEPLQPVIDVLTEEIPFLSDLGSDAVTILDLAGASESSVQALGGRVAVTTEFGFGYDTQGLFDFHAGGGLDPDLLYNGFHVLAADAEGDPVTGITLEAGITAGVEGDVTATVGIYLDDLLGDDQGRVRGGMLAATPMDQWFYASGSLSAGLRAYLEIGWPPFGGEFEFDSPRVTLISFDSRDTDVPVLAEPGQADPTRLVLNVGDRAHRRLHGDTEDRAEEITITNILGILVISGLGHENLFADSFVQIVANSGNRGDLLYVHPDVAIPVLFSGGDQRDLLTGGGDWDELNGGDGPDKLRGQGGQNILRGEADNADTIYGGAGDDQLFGQADDDRLYGGADHDMLDGGLGDDLILADSRVFRRPTAAQPRRPRPSGPGH